MNGSSICLAAQQHQAIVRLLSVLMVLLSVTSSWADQALRVGTNVWPGYEPLYLARSLASDDADRKKAWESRVRLVEYSSATEVLRAFRNKTLEAAALTMDEVLLLRQARVPVKVILVMDVSAGGDVIMARQGIQGMAGLRGRRVAVESGALGAYVITRALEIHGLTLNDIEIVHLDVSAHEEAFLSGSIDAAVTFEPVRTKLMKAGAVEVFSSREIPNEVVDVLIAHEDTLKTHAKAVRTLVDGWFDALSAMRSKPQESAARMARRLQLTPDEVLASYDGLHLPDLAENRTLLGGATPVLMQTLQLLRNTMVAQELLSSRVSPEGLLTDAYLPR